MRANDVLNDPGASEWLRTALRSALQYDAIQVANDVETLRQVLHERAADEGDSPPEAASAAWLKIVLGAGN